MKNVTRVLISIMTIIVLLVLAGCSQKNENRQFKNINMTFSKSLTKKAQELKELNKQPIKDTVTENAQPAGSKIQTAAVQTPTSPNVPPRQVNERFKQSLSVNDQPYIWLGPEGYVQISSYYNVDNQNANQDEILTWYYQLKAESAMPGDNDPDGDGILVAGCVVQPLIYYADGTVDRKPQLELSVNPPQKEKKGSFTMSVKNNKIINKFEFKEIKSGPNAQTIVINVNGSF